MMGRLEGKVAFISGVARGQGRSHAVRLAEEGADIIGFDICHDIETVPYPLATIDDLHETIKLVEDRGGRIVAAQADVRDADAVRSVFDDGLAEFGHIDIVLANAGALFGRGDTDWTGIMRAWQDGIDVMLTGVVNTVGVTIPTLMSQGTGGSIVITSSTAGLKSMTGPVDEPARALNSLSYVASKHGVIGLMRAWAGAVAHLNIRVNTIHPTSVNTPFIVNDHFAQMIEANAGSERKVIWENAMPVTMIEPEDVSNAIVWLCSEEARYVTGVTFPVDAGFMIR
jgi:SDR family mycofactocin-dependent oxidoreductase